MVLHGLVGELVYFMHRAKILPKRRNQKMPELLKNFHSGLEGAFISENQSSGKLLP